MKRSLLALPLTLLFAGAAFAVDPIEKQVQIVAQVPTDAFFVEPVGGNWMNDPQGTAGQEHRRPDHCLPGIAGSDRQRYPQHRPGRDSGRYRPEDNAS